jgi:hypothetical protein
MWKKRNITESQIHQYKCLILSNVNDISFFTSIMHPNSQVISPLSYTNHNKLDLLFHFMLYLAYQVVSTLKKQNLRILSFVPI